MPDVTEVRNVATMKGGEALARSLVREGVEVVFGLPGQQIMDAYDAIYDLPELRLVTVRNEQSSTYMALGYARTTRKIAAVLSVSGAGALNAASGLLTAYSVSTPVLLITGQVDTANLGNERGDIHEVREQLDVFRPITKWCQRVTRAEEIPSAVQRAFKEMRKGRPRPVELEIPWDVLRSKGDVVLLEPEQPLRAEPEQAKVLEAAHLLAGAEKPLIWAGGGVISSEAWRELTELAEALHAPVITTHQGKGAIREDHPLSMGVYYQGQGPAAWAVPEADVILAIGSRLFYPSKLPWAFRRDQKLIQIDVDRSEVGRNWPLNAGIVGDAKSALGALLAELGGKRHQGWTQRRLSAIKRGTRDFYLSHAPVQMEIVEGLRQELAEDAIVVPGIHNVGYWANLSFPVLKPRTWITVSYSATLGHELTAGMGASIGNPGKQVLIMCGDGGFMYGVGELATAVQEGLSLVTVVFDDGAYGASLYDQENNFRGRVIGTRLRNPQFAALAQTFGATGIKLSSYKELPAALRDALKYKGLTLIEVPFPTLPPPFLVPPPGT